jgi:hypothetical protein
MDLRRTDRARNGVPAGVGDALVGSEPSPRVVAPTEAEIALQRVMDSDLGLDLLRILARTGSVEERLAARVSIDELLDRRNGVET